MTAIVDIIGREILDSRGNPTVEVDVLLEDGIEKGIANSILVKVNQIGSLTETLAAVEMAHRAGYTCLLYTSDAADEL